MPWHKEQCPNSAWGPLRQCIECTTNFRPGTGQSAEAQQTGYGRPYTLDFWTRDGVMGSDKAFFYFPLLCSIFTHSLFFQDEGRTKENFQQALQQPSYKQGKKKRKQLKSMFEAIKKHNIRKEKLEHKGRLGKALNSITKQKLEIIRLFYSAANLLPPFFLCVSVCPWLLCLVWNPGLTISFSYLS